MVWTSCRNGWWCGRQLHKCLKNKQILITLLFQHWHWLSREFVQLTRQSHYFKTEGAISSTLSQSLDHMAIFPVFLL